MENYIVRCIWNGTKKDLRISANDARVAIDKARMSRNALKASCFIAYHRKFPRIPILTATN